METFNWEVYIANYQDIRDAGINNKIGAWNHYTHFGKNENRTDKGHIVLFDRSDRLGANINSYIAQIIYAVFKGHYIHLEQKEYRYAHSPFIKSLFSFIENYNQGKSLNVRLFYGNNHCFNGILGETTQTINCDLVTYFKSMNIKLNHNYENYDFSKTILVHLRLDDVSKSPDYDGSICTEFYKKLIENGNYCYHTIHHGGNKQAPVSDSKITSILNNYPGYNVKIITNPGSEITLPYENIGSDDESRDLFLITQAKIVILSRSTFSLSALFFGDHQTVYIPSWGHSVCLGLNTKFDKTNFNYFY
jgi:hypothetical protein